MTVSSPCINSLPIQYDLLQGLSSGSPPTSPKQFEIVEMKAKPACEMNEQWHSRLPKIHWSNVVRNTHYVCYGAKYEGEWYAVGIWSSPVAQNRFPDGKTMLELRRLAIGPSAPKYTATRMLSVMRKGIHKKFPEITRLISYQDCEVHTGTIYKADNWFIGGESAGISWTTQTRERNTEQSLARKIRWEFHLK